MTAEFKGTPGSWRYESGAIYGPADIAGNPIAILRLRPSQIPDGRLMAAAPDLLAALSEIVKADLADGRHDEYIANAQEAIAKALEGAS